MGFNVTQTMNSFNFENRENLRNAAKDILNKQGATPEQTHKILEETIFEKTVSNSDAYVNSQMAIMKASSQISLNSNLSQTLKYLKSQANKKSLKKYVFGELWNSLLEVSEEYQGELFDFEIDSNAKNIFIAA